MFSKQTITALAAIGSLGIIPLTPGLAQAAAYTLDFDHDAKGNVIDFNNFDLLVGDWSADKPDDYDKNDYKVSDQWLEDFGVTISTNKNKGVVLFNTDPNYYAPDSAAYNPKDRSGWLKDFDNDLLTGEYLEYKADYDGGSTNLGNVLIIQEDNKYYQPDDRAKGGTISFDFEELVSLSSIDLLDIDEFKKNKLVTFQAFGEDGSEIGTWDFDENSAVQLSKSDGDNSLYRFNFDATGVSRLSVIYPGSGAIAALRWEENQAPPTIPEPAAIIGLLTVAGLGLRRNQQSQTA